MAGPHSDAVTSEVPGADPDETPTVRRPRAPDSPGGVGEPAAGHPIERPLTLAGGTVHAASARFELTSRIGAGNHGVVFRARDHQLGRDVAIKRFSHFLADDPRAMHRITREVETLARVSHPSVVTVHDLVHMPDGDGEVTPHLVMELVEGTSLRDLLGRFGPSPRAIMVVLGLLDGLAACHRSGILHLDVKPANVLVTADGAVKIVDFGIARAASDAAATATVAGTPHYMAPEQYENKADERSDVYSVGCVLYECLTGSTPFPGTMAVQLMAHRGGPRPDPRVLAPWVGPELAAVVLRAMAIDPAHRHASILDLRAALAAAAHDVADPATRPAPAAPTAPATHPTTDPSTNPGARADVPRAAPAPAPSPPPPDVQRVGRLRRVRGTVTGLALVAWVLAVVPGVVWGLGWIVPADYRPSWMDGSTTPLWLLAGSGLGALVFVRRARRVGARVRGPRIGEPAHPRGLGLVARTAVVSGVVGSSPLLVPVYLLVLSQVAGAAGLVVPTELVDDGWGRAWAVMPAAAILLTLRAVLGIRPRVRSVLWSGTLLGGAALAAGLFVIYPVVMGY